MKYGKTKVIIKTHIKPKMIKNAITSDKKYFILIPLLVSRVTLFF